MELLAFNKAPKGAHFGVIIFTEIRTPGYYPDDSDDEPIVRYHVFDTAEGAADFIHREVVSYGRYHNCKYLLVHVDKVGQATTTTQVTF